MNENFRRLIIYFAVVDPDFHQPWSLALQHMGKPLPRKLRTALIIPFPHNVRSSYRKSCGKRDHSIDG